MAKNAKYHELMEILPDHGNFLVKLLFHPDREARFTVVTVIKEQEHFEGAFFCLPDANECIYKLVYK